MKRIEYYYGQALAGLLSHGGYDEINSYVDEAVRIGAALDAKAKGVATANSRRNDNGKAAWHGVVRQLLAQNPTTPSELLRSVRNAGHQVSLMAVQGFLGQEVKRGLAVRVERGLYQAKVAKL